MEFFGNIIKGIMIGIANIIPGVSGGTMAVSLGIYDRLIGSISGLFREFKKSILFLIPIIIGAGIGIVGFTYAIEYLLDKHTFVTCMAFVGLILGGLPAIFSSMRAKVSSGGVGVFGILAFVIAFAISGGMPLLKESKDALTVIAVTPGNMVILFILGIVASATMVIPGVSGSMMLMIFAMLVTIFAIGTELKAGTAREWLDTAGGSVFAALVGKMLPLVVMMLLMTLMMFLILFKIVGVPLNGSLTALLFGCMLFVLAYMAIGVLIVTLLSNLRLSLSIGGGYSVLAFTFSGLTFPMMAMYPWVQAFSKIFPFTFYTDIFIDQALRGAPVVDSLWDMGYIALFIVLPMLCLPRLRKICSDEKYWGRM